MCKSATKLPGRAGQDQGELAVSCNNAEWLHPCQEIPAASRADGKETFCGMTSRCRIGRHSRLPVVGLCPQRVLRNRNVPELGLRNPVHLEPTLEAPNLLDRRIDLVIFFTMARGT